jgi:hypothetical protein
MKTRAFTLMALLAATPLWARIIVDDSAPEPGPEQGIHVPAPATGPAAGSDATPQQDTLAFLNKDQLHGYLLAIDADGSLHWQSPEARDPIVFKDGAVSQIKLDSHKPAATTSEARIVLTNGDILPGNIVSLDDKTLALDTWYAGRISVPRAMLRSISPLSDTANILYAGPTSLDGWTVGRMGNPGSWSYKDGALIGNSYGTIGRDVKLPDMSILSFDLNMQGNQQIGIGIYADHPDITGNCYMLQLSGGFAELQRYSRNTGSTVIGNAQMQNAIRHDKTHVELRTSKDKKSIWLLLDGKMMKQWTDPADFSGGGGSIIFAAQPGSIVKISGIKVARWNGKFDESASPTGKTGSDTVQLANDDKVTGHLESIQDGKAKFSSDYAELTIPLERVEELDLANTSAGQATAAPANVRAWLPDGGNITMQLTQWDAKTCTGSSPNFGTATFSPDAFSRIEFNLQAPERSAPDADNSAPDTDNTDQEGNQ